MSNREKLSFGLTIAAAVIVPGLSAALLHSIGYSTLGTLTWVIGYGTGVGAIWFVWLRPLNLHDPSGGPPDDPDRD